MNTKVVYVFKNANRNNKEFAIVSFKNKKDLEQARKYSISYYNTKLAQEKAYTENNNKIALRRNYLRKDSKNTWRTSYYNKIESSEDEYTSDKKTKQEPQRKSVYSKEKRKEIREGKKREVRICSTDSLSKAQNQDPHLQDSMDHMLQLIRGLEDKIHSMEWEASNRS